MARLATILSFGDHSDDAVPEQHAASIDAHDDAASDASDDSFEFAFARPLIQTHSADALADDLFAHGRILPAYYPVFRRHHPHDDASSASSATAPPSPDTYCAWAPRSAPGSPARDLPKSASTGQAVHRFRLRDLVGAGAGRRSHSDGKEKFLFLQQQSPKSSKTSAPPAAAAAPAPAQAAKKPSSQPKQGKKKGAAAVTEMDMATAHRLFYSKPSAASATGTGTDRTNTTKKSYLPYRPSIVGFFAAAHGLRPKHHPY
jgi:pyruvate/2-oxoglutarate dehydrogenase complex dihydrolipoamide acyltransferase (E2) component